MLFLFSVMLNNMKFYRSWHWILELFPSFWLALTFFRGGRHHPCRRPVMAKSSGRAPIFSLSYGHISCRSKGCSYRYVFLYGVTYSQFKNTGLVYAVGMVGGWDSAVAGGWITGLGWWLAVGIEICGHSVSLVPCNPAYISCRYFAFCPGALVKHLILQ